MLNLGTKVIRYDPPMTFDSLYHPDRLATKVAQIPRLLRISAIPSILFHTHATFNFPDPSQGEASPELEHSQYNSILSLRKWSSSGKR